MHIMLIAPLILSNVSLQATRLMTRMKESRIDDEDENSITNLENKMENVFNEDWSRPYNLTEICYHDLAIEIEKRIHRRQPLPKPCGNLIDFHISMD